jgi:hypothetical protein
LLLQMKGHGKKKDVRTPKLRKEQFLQALGFDFLNADIELSRAGDASDAAAGDAAAEAGPTKLRKLFEGTGAELKVAEDGARQHEKQSADQLAQCRGGAACTCSHPAVKAGC